ncbi:hypothetical protein NP233_g6601 [Leucocoprinus birnbaumii]|uniref:Aminoglycoside phosphotransferase domain-containing protein n=1 Tax=Leucocoprinus birnbaumii TaxID=56174 RepID=A0AAD5YVE1_9AGAR|nr:hypothetical protein NP233_g6601 [Leucocoprinus birnbaumii]
MRERDPWARAKIDLDALHEIVANVFRIPTSQCGLPVAIGLQQQANYARVYSFQLPSRIVVARVVAPVRPLFKTESEVTAMDFVRDHTSLPVPKVYAYCSEAMNPVGAEWIIMDFMPGVGMGTAWPKLQLPQKRRLALDIIDLHDQLFRLKADACGGLYHIVDSVDDHRAGNMKSVNSRPPRWAPLSIESLHTLNNLCNYSIHNAYKIGPIHSFSLLDFNQEVPSPSQTLPVMTSGDYVKLIAFCGNPPTRGYYDLPSREKCVELFENIFGLYTNSSALGPNADPLNFRFSHGDLHDENILIDPQSGAITGIIDWEAAGFRPSWSVPFGVGWFDEDGERFLFGADDPANFEEDSPEDADLRAFFRTQMYRRNPDLFSCFFGGIELRAVLHAAADYPRPAGNTDIFLGQYHKLGYWNEDRRGAFPWNMEAWMIRRLDLNDEQARLHPIEDGSEGSVSSCGGKPESDQSQIPRP